MHAGKLFFVSSVSKIMPYFAPGTSFVNQFKLNWDSGQLFDTVAMFPADLPRGLFF